MTSLAALRPGAALGSYPERRRRNRSKAGTGLINRPCPTLRLRHLQQFVAQVESHSSRLKPLSNQALAGELQRARQQLLKNGLTAEAVSAVFAALREFAERRLGKRPYEVQLMGAWVMLNGHLAEMATGEGKSLTAALAAAAAALAGIPVHIITVNDYLVERDAQVFRAFYEAVGLTVGAISATTPPSVRHEVYRRNIVYCTNKQLVFDYLRDRLATPARSQGWLASTRHAGGNEHAEGMLLRGLCLAIVDEADSVLIDEARTPLVLSAAIPGKTNPRPYEQALALASSMKAQHDFSIDHLHRTVTLSAAGMAKIAPLAASLPAPWTGRVQTQFLITQALAALHLYRRNEHYLLVQNKIAIVDPNTGRVLSDRHWEHGLHQLIETREGVPLTVPSATLAKISFQAFFSRYLRLAGMSGTAVEVRDELRRTYGLRVVNIPTRRPTRRASRPLAVYCDDEARWRAVLADVLSAHRAGRPVLIGTTSVEQSEALSKRLHECNLPHQVLNAHYPHFEASVVATAGKAGRITVATNMAGRGTDITLEESVIQRGGLHVISFTANAAQRIDRQLAGRCGRQGEPGSFQPFAALSDPQMIENWPAWVLRWAARMTDQTGHVFRFPGSRLVRVTQRRLERLHAQERLQMLQSEDAAERSLAFARRPD